MVDKNEEMVLGDSKIKREKKVKRKKTTVNKDIRLKSQKSENINVDGDSKKKKKRKNEFDVTQNSSPTKKVKSEKPKGKENVKKKEKLQKKIQDKKKKFTKDGKDGKDKKSNDKNEPIEKLTKKEEREKQKKLKAERKSKKITAEGVFDLGVKAKMIWEEVRQEDCKEEKKDKLLKDLHGLVKGNAKKLVFAHDTVRVIECLMALGSAQIRTDLFEELKEDLLDMSKSDYGNFFVKKMLKYGTKEQRNRIFKMMEGKVAKLMKHKIGGFVVELAYNDYANAAQRNCMLQEFLGPEYRLFKEPEIRTVPEILEKHPEKRSELVKNMAANVDVLIQKGTYNHSLVHTVLHNYLVVAEKEKRADCIEQLREAILHMIHSRDGAMAGMIAIWHGTAKDRKAIIKSFKTHVTKIAMEEYGHAVLLAIFDSVDDTKLVGKAIVGEIAENIDQIAANKYGIRVVKYLIAGRATAYIAPHVLKLLEQGDGNEHSKKDLSLRHSELATVAAAPILSWVTANLGKGLYDPPTTITFTAIINHSPVCQQLTDLLSELAEEAVKPFIPGDAEQPNIVESGASHMLLKKIIIKDKERSAIGQDTFSNLLLKNIDSEGLDAWATCNRGAMLLVYMYETAIKEVESLVQEKVESVKRTLQRQKTKGAEILLKKLNL